MESRSCYQNAIFEEMIIILIRKPNYVDLFLTDCLSTWVM